MRKFFIFICIIIVISSCQEEGVRSTIVKKSTISINNSKHQQIFGEDLERLKLVALYGDYKTPIAVAQQIAMEIATEMRKSEGAMLMSPLKIASVEKIKWDKKEKITDITYEEQDIDNVSDMYLFNFDDNQGYVLMSADERVYGILAYSSKGHLGDNISSPVQAILLERSFNYIEKKRKEFDKFEENLIIEAEEDIFQKLPQEKQNKLVNKGVFNKKGKRIVSYSSTIECEDKKNRYLSYWDDCYDYCNDYCRWNTNSKISKWRTIEKHRPLVKTLWGQGNGYNNFATTSCSSDSRAPVGCVAVAVGQILAYHWYPTYFKGRYMNWNKMINVTKGKMFSDYTTVVDDDAKADISHLLFRLGDRDLLNMDYGCDGSGARTYNALWTFRKLGYRNAYITMSNHSRIISEIRKNRPVFIDGSSKRKRRCFIWCWTRYSGGHAWVLDGYVKMQQKVTRTSKYSCDGGYGCDTYRDDTHTYTNTIELIHNNFGWGVGNSYELEGNAQDTGWYHRGLYDSNNKPDKKSNTAFRSEDPRNFQYRNRIIINIK